jgi:hypothetical protein
MKVKQTPSDKVALPSIAFTGRINNKVITQEELLCSGILENRERVSSKLIWNPVIQ